jgi:protein TonB
MRDVEFGRHAVPTIPARRRLYTVALLVHVLVFGALVVMQRAHPIRIGAGASSQMGIAAYVPGPVGTAGTSAQRAAQVQPKKKPAPRAASSSRSSADEPTGGSSEAAAGQAGSGGSGPVRLGSGGNLTLLNKVTPVYPRMLEAARMTGSVVLDAVIHRDGSIGDITVLKSSHPSFAQAAVEAVKQWRYTPLPFEGIVTVTVNFTVPR